VLLLVAVVAMARPAHADEPTAAGALLEQAEAAFVGDSDCRRALPLFEGAYRLEPSWIALSGMATCHELSGEVDVAYRLYQRILHDYGAALPERRRQRVEARLAELEPQLGTLTVHLDPPGATLRVDGEEVTSPVRLRPGAHVVVASAPGRRDASVTVTAAPGVASDATLTLPPPPIVPAAPSPPATRPPPPPPPPPAAPRPAHSPWIWRSVALSGAALAASGATLLVLSQRDFDAFDDAVAAARGNPALPVDVDRSRLDAGREKRATGAALLGVGLAAAAGAALWHFWPSAVPAHPTPSVDVHASSGGLGLSAAWSF
jgi:hypothetical protein